MFLFNSYLQKNMIKNKVTFHFKYPIHYQKRVGWGERGGGRGSLPATGGEEIRGGGGEEGRWGEGGGKARRRRWGAGGCSMGVKRSPEVEDDDGDQ